jgi:hypothetical protein
VHQASLVSQIWLEAAQGAQEAASKLKTLTYGLPPYRHDPTSRSWLAVGAQASISLRRFHSTKGPDTVIPLALINGV